MSLFYVLASLPKLEFGSKPDVTTTCLLELFDLNLSIEGIRQLNMIRSWIDLANISRMIHHDHLFDERGNFSKSTLKELLQNQEVLAEYVFEFFSKFENEEEKKQNFSFLIARYFEEARKSAKGYLAEFLKFENEWRILVAAFMAKRAGQSIAYALRYEVQTDPIVQMALVQKDSAGPFVFPFEYSDLERSIQEAGDDPTKLMQVLLKYRFDFYGEVEYDFPFSLRRVVAYLMQLMCLEEMFALNQIEGEKQLMKLLERADAS